jgi:hypothetical protein
MSEHKTFTHKFLAESESGWFSFDTDAHPPAEIRLETDSGGLFWITANREGWLHLARVCAELGLANFEGGFHFHKNSHFVFTTHGSNWSFGVDETLGAQPS